MPDPSFNYVHIRDAVEILTEFDGLLRERMLELEKRADSGGEVNEVYLSTRHVLDSADAARRALELIEEHVNILRPVWAALEDGEDLGAALENARQLRKGP